MISDKTQHKGKLSVNAPFYQVNCNLCGENEVKTVQVEGVFKVVRCQNCGLVYVNPQPCKDDISVHYDESYYLPWLKEQSSMRLSMWKKRLMRINTFKTEGKLLDVGSGTGLFLNEAKKNGWQVQGTEVSEYAAAHTKKTFGIDVFRGLLAEANFADNFFDVVTFWHVLEHTRDPLSNLIEAKRIVKPDGVIVIAIPNINNYIYRIAYVVFKGKRLKIFDAEAREVHLYHFSVDTLRKMIEKVGLSPMRFDVDKERIGRGELFLDNCAWLLYKLIKVNIASAIEVYARKV